MQAALPPCRYQNPRRFQVASSYWRLDLHRLAPTTPLSLFSISPTKHRFLFLFSFHSLIFYVMVALPVPALGVTVL